MHTAIGSLRLRSRGAHCELRSRGAHCDPELARQDRRSRLARKEARRKEKGGGRGGGGGGGGGGRTAVIKSNNPHLAGGEKHSRVLTDRLPSKQVWLDGHPVGKNSRPSKSPKHKPNWDW